MAKFVIFCAGGFEKLLQPYVTEEMASGAQFEIFGFLMAENSP